MIFFKLNNRKGKMEENKFQTYEEFMDGVKRKRILPKELRLSPIPKGFPALSKKEIFSLILKGVIKIDFKAPFMVFNNGKRICDPEFDDLCFEEKGKRFEVWWLFKKKTSRLFYKEASRDYEEHASFRKFSLHLKGMIYCWEDLEAFIHYESHKRF